MKALHASWLPGAQQHQIVNQPIKLQTKNPLSRPQPWLKCFQSYTFFIWYRAHTDKFCESQIVHLGHINLYQVSNNTSGISSPGDAKRSSEDIWNIKPILFRSYQSHCASHFWENWGHWSGHISPFVSKPPRGQSTALGGARSLFHSCDHFFSFHFLFNLFNFFLIQSNAIFVIVQIFSHVYVLHCIFSSFHFLYNLLYGGGSWDFHFMVENVNNNLNWWRRDSSKIKRSEAEILDATLRNHDLNVLRNFLPLQLPNWQHISLSLRERKSWWVFSLR